MSILPSPISNHSRSRYPCSICHLEVGRDSLQCSVCFKWVHFLCSSLTRADFHTVCATGTAVGWRCPACCPLSQTGSPTQISSPVTSASPPPPSPGLPLLPPGLYQPRPSQGPPRYPCSMCSHKVGKDSLKCSTCSKWVHFCSSLTRANFCKICVAGFTMGWNYHACRNGDLASPTHQQASLRSIFPALPPPTPPHQHVQLKWIHLYLSPHTLLSFNTYPLSAFTLPFTPPPPASTQPIYNSLPHPQQTQCLPQNLRILQWNAGGLSPLASC